MTGSVQKQYPAIKGLTWHRRQYYSFFIPMDWHKFSWSDGSQGEIHGPDLDDPLTVFAIKLIDLGTAVTGDDLGLLAESFFTALERLPAVQITERHQKATGKLLQLEAKYTFQEGAATRQCWVCVFYHETRQITMTAQGATVEKYEYWLPMFFEAMMTARVHNQIPDITIFD